MKKQLIKGISFATVVCLSMSTPANAASWSLVNNIWNYTDDSGVLTKGWRWIDSNNDGISKCYYFDTEGRMLASCMTPDEFTVNESGAWTKEGTIQYKAGAWASWPNEKGETKWYYQNADGTFVTNGWRLLDGNHDGISEYYYFDAAGQMLETTLTPDGKSVNNDGKMLDENGNIVTVETPNTKSFGLKSTGNAVLGRGGSSGGSSGGGGGSSSGGGSSRSSSHSSSNNNSTNTSQSNGGDTSEQKMDGMRPVIATEEPSNSCYYTIADYRYGSSMSDLVSDKEQSAVDKKIKNFVDKYIKGSESDFLKVELIVAYLTKNVSYDCDDDGSSTKFKTAYEALCKGKAQCMGYADAFLQMATAVGLDARYVYSDINAFDNSLHVYNLVRVEGEWLIVDPTNAFNWGDYSELSNNCVLMSESDLDEYGYISSAPIEVCYGTPETRFAYDGPNMIRGDEIQTADGKPDISNYPDMISYLNKLYCTYTSCTNEANDTLCYTGTDDQTAADRIVKKLLSYVGTDKRLAILWDRTTYDEAMKKAHEIVKIIHDEGYEVVIPYGAEYVLDEQDVFNYDSWELECIEYTHRSFWQIKEISEAVPEETEEVVEQHEEVSENDTNNEEVVEAENSIDTDDGNDTTSDDAESDNAETDDTSSIEESEGEGTSNDSDDEANQEDANETTDIENTSGEESENSNHESSNSNDDTANNDDVTSNDNSSNENSDNESNNSNG
ncbi:transglutaminase domain-containing protein [Oribacterium sp. P6A1]|uniref:transglutaminase domain-containing protein n=1 Tax=Oribacterium sp. P6A1 TaxID=1410612 RepID=UPI0012DCEFD4|nr:transglutaminase domain-containing protein [Oribacterium sp. P6A1]